MPDGDTQILRLYVFWPFGLEGLWLRYAALQNLIPSFPWIVPLRPPPWRNPRKGRDQILPSGNTDCSGHFHSLLPCSDGHLSLRPPIRRSRRLSFRLILAYLMEAFLASLPSLPLSMLGSGDDDVLFVLTLLTSLLRICMHSISDVRSTPR